MIGLQAPVDELRVASSVEPASVVDILRRNGIAVVPEFVGGSALEGLLDDHRRMVECARGGDPPRGKNLLGCRVGNSCRTDFQAIHSVFFTEWANAVVSGYLGSKCAFNEAVFCTHECEPLKPITAPHFDAVQALKLFVYLTDTTERNGAFRYAPGTHIANAVEALHWRESGGRIVDTPKRCISGRSRKVGSIRRQCRDASDLRHERFPRRWNIAFWRGTPSDSRAVLSDA